MRDAACPLSTRGAGARAHLDGVRAWRDEEGLLERQEERDLWAGGRTADEQIADKDEQGSGQQGLASKRAPAVGALEAPGL